MDNHLAYLIDQSYGEKIRHKPRRKLFEDIDYYLDREQYYGFLKKLIEENFYNLMSEEIRYIGNTYLAFMIENCLLTWDNVNKLSVLKSLQQ